MPRCYFLVIVLVIVTMVIYKEVFKNTKMRKMLLIIGFVKMLYFAYFQTLFDVIPR